VNGRHETPQERHDRELIELLNELRVAMPGVQVLFAFLLAVPFAKGWPRVTPFERDVFFVAFIAAATSSALLMAVSSIHRIGWRVSNKEKIVLVGTWLTIAGLFSLAVAIVAVVLLVTDYIFGGGTAAAAAAAVAALIGATWYGLAFLLREER
jgi:membrane-bound acyltransferase YfiQ involved in biofilm formation